MSYRGVFSGVAVALAVTVPGVWLYRWQVEARIAAQWSTIDRYCADFHNDIDLAGGLALD
jgi:hypothetical protein